jgi:adhesin transport system membrane fusion protein
MSRLSHWGDYEFALDVEAAKRLDVNPRAKTLLYGMIGFLVIAVLWANFAILDEVTHADGKVVPSSQVQIIQYLEGGIIKQIMVEEGELVSAGQVIARIDDTSFSANLGELNAGYFALLGRMQRLGAEANGTAPTFSPVLTAEHRNIATAERNLYNARQAGLESQLAILGGQTDQRKQELAELRDKLSQQRRSLVLLREEYDITKPLAEQGIVSQVDLLRLRREINELAGEISSGQLSIPRVQSAIDEASRRVEELVLGFRAESSNDLVEVQSQLSALEETISAARDRVARTEIRSPVAGIVKEIRLKTVGGVLQPGEELMQVVPIEDSLLIEARVRPDDIGFLRIGQDSIVKLSAYDYAIYGGLPAILERISADTIQDEEGNPFYKVTVRTEQNYVERGSLKLPIIPGMVATVDILTGEKSVMQYLLKPLNRAREMALTER